MAFIAFLICMFSIKFTFISCYPRFIWYYTLPINPKNILFLCFIQQNITAESVIYDHYVTFNIAFFSFFLYGNRCPIFNVMKKDIFSLLFLDDISLYSQCLLFFLILPLLLHVSHILTRRIEYVDYNRVIFPNTPWEAFSIFLYFSFYLLFLKLISVKKCFKCISCHLHLFLFSKTIILLPSLLYIHMHI